MIHGKQTFIGGILGTLPFFLFCLGGDVSHAPLLWTSSIGSLLDSPSMANSIRTSCLANAEISESLSLHRGSWDWRFW